jgi:preprotein translocase subunit SecF
MISSIVTISVFGFQWGVDFRGGSLWQMGIENTTSDEVRSFFADTLGVEVSSVSYDRTTDTYALSFEEISDATRQEYFEMIKEAFPSAEEQDFWVVSPVVSEELKQKSMRAIGLVLLGISLYIAFAFRKVSRPIASWKYGIVTLVTLTHDVLVPAGLFAILGIYAGALVDVNFVVALLVVMGFSVHDTIVVFDRVRENILRSSGKEGIEETVNKSVNETLHRSINTSLTLIVVLLALYFVGPVSLRYFILTILVGTIAGTYSSIFIASPLLVVVSKAAKK